jgi:UDP-N-acetylmuramate--alanine ligase
MSGSTNISNFKNIYFIGVGGIGMSALAKYFSVTGKKVAGYDKVASEITASLENQGIAIHYLDDVKKIPQEFLNKQDTLVVFTPAIPNTHTELNYFKNKGFTVLKRAEVLGLITNETFCFAVAGTHGKTTTSTILGHILKETGVNATSFLGGIATNYNSNLILGNDKVSVVEADEYDRSFLKLKPNYACITSMDADHLDIYGQADALENSFKDFSKIVSDKLFVKEGLPLSGITYGFSNEADYQAKNIKSIDGNYFFDVKTPSQQIENIKLNLLGKHNVSNALVALAMANEYGVSLNKIKKAIENFKGIERRFNIRINTQNLVLIDDYAHHPTEINAVYNTIKTSYPNKEKIVVFQPHLYSRTKDFADDFAISLAQFDKVLLLDIYPARELPIDGITSNWLASKIKNYNTDVKVLQFSANEIFNEIEKLKNVTIAMLGAGDIGVMIKKIVKKFEKDKIIKQ